jgi:hypothetical protein
LREALARSDHDFILTAPRRPKKPVSREPGTFSKMMSALARHPKRTLLSVVFTGVFCGIAANALFFQTARHPAPIFAGPVIARPMQQAAPVPPSVPRQVETPAPANAIAKLIDAPAPAVAAPQPVQASSTASYPASVSPSARSTSAPKDQIGALLGVLGDDGADVARVMAVQKALVKLGYVVKPDGVMGNGTRQALQSFEQSRKLTVTGELTPRTLRELGAQSGVTIP